MKAKTTPTYLMVGFSSYLLSHYGDQLPDGSLVVVESEEVIRKRRVRERTAEMRCVADVIAHEIQSREGVEALVAELDAQGFRVIIPGVEYGVPGAALLAERWGVPGLGSRGAWALRDKHALRTACEGTGIMQPAFALCDTPQQAHDFFTAHGPCVIKPTLRQGSLGISLVSSATQLDSAFAMASSVIEKGRSDGADPDRILAESLALGPEVSVEAFVCDGTIIFSNVTAKSLFDGPYPVERGHVAPAPVSSEVALRLRNSMYQLVECLDIRTGVLHAEWILVDGVPTLVECAGRQPGDRITEIIDEAYGIDFLQTLLDIYSGQTPQLPLEASRAAAVEFVASDRPAIGFTGEEDAAKMPGVLSVEMDIKHGDQVLPLRCVGDRAGSVLAVGATATVAQRFAREACDAIHFTYVTSNESGTK